MILEKDYYKKLTGAEYKIVKYNIDKYFIKTDFGLSCMLPNKRHGLAYISVG